MILTEQPASTRSESMSDRVRRNSSHGSAENENTNKHEDDEELRSELLRDLPEWLQDFKENLVDKNVRPHQYSSSSSRELPMDPRAKVYWARVSRVSTLTSLRHCDICLKTEISRASSRRRAGTVVPKAENFGDLTPADRKILSEESEPRNNHRHAVVVQDLATGRPVVEGTGRLVVL